MTLKGNNELNNKKSKLYELMRHVRIRVKDLNNPSLKLEIDILAILQKSLDRAILL